MKAEKAFDKPAMNGCKSILSFAGNVSMGCEGFIVLE
jgi:hypothetical protein